MKKYLYILTAALLAFVACSQEKDLDEPVTVDPVDPVVVEDNPVTSEPITITATLPEKLTKVTFTPNEDGSGNPILALTWKTSDKLRVADHANPSSYTDFDLDESSVRTKKGIFTGTPVSASSYDVSVVYDAVDFADQKQPSDGSAGNLQYISSVEDISDLSTINFTSISGALALIATMPSTEIAAVIKSVDITASEDIFNGGNTLSITLNSTGDDGADGKLTFYATLPGTQAIPAGTTLLMKFNAPGESHDVYTRFSTIPSAASFLSGKLNVLATDCRGVATHAGSYTNTDGSAEHPYLVGDKYQLAAISSELSTTEKKYFKLVDNITVSSWTPINCDEKGAINLNGNGNKTISGLDHPLFVYFDGEVYDLNITNATITGGNYYGVLIRTISEGKNGCVISNVNVTNSSVSGGHSLGGLIGRISASSCTITDCSTAVSVIGTDYYHGGLVGDVTNGTFTRCSATGNVTNSRAEKYGFAGGLIGRMANGTIEKCHYTTGTVSTTAPNAASGGLIGDASGTINISKSFFNGTVSGSQYLGGLIGDIESTGNISITDCYSSGSVSGTGNYCGGFLGLFDSSASVTVNRGYINSSISGGKWSAGVFGGGNAAKTYTNYTCSGVVGWNTSSRQVWAYNISTAPDGNYMGTEGTIYSQAVTLGGWDFSNVWTTDPTPQLR